MQILISLKSKSIALKILGAKIVNILGKTLNTLKTSPGLLPRKVYRKLRRILLNRVDLGFLYRNHVRIGGNFYPVSDLLPAVVRRGPETAIPTIYVIIPVYRNVEITVRCIESVIASKLPTSAKILILNDCSPDPEMTGALDHYKSNPLVEVRHNGENLGFVRNVNLGISVAGSSDVVLLNSDTVVAGDWLQRLYAHSKSHNLVSSVTATSNNATICSFPIMEGTGSWPLDESTPSVQAVLGRHNNARSTIIPTAVGFCMYITRRSLNVLGGFDEEAFGKGYGEENDFCLRGLKRGWRHLQALDVAVFHEGEVSFGQSSHPGKKRAAEIILNRYPDYNAIVGEFAQRDMARAVRLGALLTLIAKSKKPVELICTHIHGGGVEKAVSKFVKDRTATTHFLSLQRASEKGFYKITSLIDSAKFELEFSAHYSREVFSAVLHIAQISKFHVHHVMDFDSGMLDVLRHSKIQFDFYIHDYWTICPQVTLTTVDGDYCGEPRESICNACIARRGERTHAPLADGLSHDIVRWRSQYKWLFEAAKSISAPSYDVRSRIKKYFPAAEIQVVYHEDQTPLKNILPRPKLIKSSLPLKVGVLGSIGAHKGLFKISNLQNEIQKLNAPVEITIFGETDPLLPMKHPVKVTGRYHDKDLPRLLEEAGIHVLWFPEGAPETYSFTLSHAIGNGYPVVAPNIGAFSERLIGRPWTTLTELSGSSQDILAKLLDLRSKMIQETEKSTP